MKSRLTLGVLALSILVQNPHAVRIDPPEQRQRARVSYLARIVQTPLGDSPEVGALRVQNPEWQLFTYSFATFAMANILASDPSRADELIPAMRAAIRNSNHALLRRYFNTVNTTPAEDAHRQAIFYGHRNLMMGLYAERTGDRRYDAQHTAMTQALFDAVMASPTRNIESYPGRIWPADNSVVMASLAVYDRTHDTDHALAARQWVDWINDHFLDDHGLMHSQIDPQTHGSLDGPRGCSIAWTSAFAGYFDPEFAGQQYDAMKEHLGGELLGVPMFREYPGDHSTGLGDIDSGPIVFGYGVAATGLGYVAAQAAGDRSTARGIRVLIDTVGLEQRSADERHYGLFSPLSDALILFGESTLSLQ